MRWSTPTPGAAERLELGLGLLYPWNRLEELLTSIF